MAIASLAATTVFLEACGTAGPYGRGYDADADIGDASTDQPRVLSDAHVGEPDASTDAADAGADAADDARDD